MTVFLTTHYMQEAEELCDRIALMHLGRIRVEGTPAELKAPHGATATLEDVFRHATMGEATDEQGGGLRDVRATRRTARRVG
jgi:ABC-2 type transport system ATP-binding protein